MWLTRSDMALRYEILGALRVVDERGSTYLSAPKIERLLAALLVRADHLVPAEQLFSEIWDGRPPRRAAAGLHVYVSQLRKFLDRPGRNRSPIVTRPPGYLLQLGADELDAHEFLRLAQEGRRHSQRHEHEEALDRFERALAVWRGRVLGDLPMGPVVDGYATWLAEERLECIEQSIDARLALGRHREVIGLLYALTAEYPLRETFTMQLMMALHRSERRPDALRAYESSRRALERELGVDPGHSLQSLRRAILVGDAWLGRVGARDEAAVERESRRDGERDRRGVA
jgi:DNA-binding SARP family transcriptional activator